MIKTRCVVTIDSPVEINPVEISELFKQWTILAELVEQKLSLGKNELLVWSLGLAGSQAEDWYIYAQVDLCVKGQTSSAELMLTHDELAPHPTTRCGVLSQKRTKQHVHITKNNYGDEDEPLTAEQQAHQIVQELRE